MVTLTYDFYKNEYNGYLDEDSFSKLLNKSRLKLDYYTYDRVSKLSDLSDEILVYKVRLCLCALTDKISKYTNNGVEEDFLKTSESVGPWSISYSNNKVSGKTGSIYKCIVDEYLGNTNLMCSWIL